MRSSGAAIPDTDAYPLKIADEVVEVVVVVDTIDAASSNRLDVDAVEFEFTDSTDALEGSTALEARLFVAELAAEVALELSLAEAPFGAPLAPVALLPENLLIRPHESAGLLLHP